MTLGRFLCAATLALTTAFPLLAHTTGGLQVKGAYATATPMAGAVYFTIENHSASDDRLISATTEVAAKAELHTSKADADGVMRMTPIEGGIAVPMGKSHDLAPGADHLMLMGLRQKLRPGDTFPLTVTFETFGPVTFEVTVVKPGAGAADAEDHSAHTGHGTTN